MIEAVAIDSKGNPTGMHRFFNEQQWDTLTRTYGKKLRWKSLEVIEEPAISEEKIKEIFEEEKSETPSDENIFNERLQELTKRELIAEYGLPEDFMKETKSKIIETIISGI